MPVPWSGGVRKSDSSVQTGADEVYVRVSTPPRSSCHAPGTLTMPLPCPYAGTSSIHLAELESARRRAAGVTPRSVAFAAESSSATAPAVCGEAIEVPFAIRRPGGSW
jgi:hypothetical protein